MATPPKPEIAVIACLLLCVAIIGCDDPGCPEGYTLRAGYCISLEKSMRLASESGGSSGATGAVGAGKGSGKSSGASPAGDSGSVSAGAPSSAAQPDGAAGVRADIRMESNAAGQSDAGAGSAGAGGSVSQLGAGAGSIARSAAGSGGIGGNATGSASAGEGDGRTTACALVNGGCSRDALCVDQDNFGPICTCSPGMTGSGIGLYGCTDVNECAVNNGDCSLSPKAVCTNFVRAPRTCVCPSGSGGGGVGKRGCVFVLDDFTAKDTSTGLTWQRAVSTQTYIWDDAERYCTNLRLPESGWRIPTMKELGTIHETEYMPHIDPVAFPNTPSGFFWTATLLPNGFVQTLAFNEASSGDSLATSSRASIRCVR